MMELSTLNTIIFNRNTIHHDSESLLWTPCSHLSKQMHHVDIIYQIENIADRSDRDTMIYDQCFATVLAAALHYYWYLHNVDILDNLDKL